MAAKNSTYDEKKKSRKLFVFIAISIAVIIALACLLVALQLTANRIAEAKFREFITNSEIPYHVSWSKINYNLCKRQLDIFDLSVDAASANVVSISKIVDGSPLPKNAVISVQSFNVPVNAAYFGRLYQPLTSMGYRYLVGSATFTISLSPDSQLDFAVTDMTIAELGAIDAKIAISEVRGQSLQGLFSSLNNKIVLSAWGSFEDNGFTDRMIGIFAADTNTSKDKAKAKALDGLNRRIHTQFKADSEQRRSVVQLYRFLDNPKKLTIQITGGETIILVRTLFQPANVTGWRSLAAWFINIPQEIAAN